MSIELESGVMKSTVMKPFYIAVYYDPQKLLRRQDEVDVIFPEHYILELHVMEWNVSLNGSVVALSK